MLDEQPLPGERDQHYLPGPMPGGGLQSPRDFGRFRAQAAPHPWFRGQAAVSIQPVGFPAD